MTSEGVTVGVPLYNEARHIEQALRSAAGQCDALLVSDNASTDGSAELCERVASEFPNVRVIRQGSNIGALHNFKFLLDSAETPRFMWLGAHDFMPAGYVEALSEALDAHPGAALAFGMTRNVNAEGAELGWYRYDYHARIAGPSRFARLEAMIRYLKNCSMMHGLFRTDLLRKSWEQGNFLGFDKVLLSRTAVQGPLIYVPRTHLCRRIVHADDTLHKRLVRIRGSESLGTPSRQEMQVRLEAVVREASQDAGWQGYWLRLKCRVALIYRYGPYGVTPGARATSAVLHPVTRAVRAIRRQLRWCRRPN